MRLVKKKIDKDGPGFMILQPEEPEDFWHAYHLIAKGDAITALTFRKVQKSTATGSVTSERIKLRITIAAEEIHFDPQSCQIRIRGKNVRESDHIKLGQYHTLELAENRQFTLEKPHWDSIFLDRVEKACDMSHRAEVAAVVMQPGLANLMLITPHMTTVRSKIQMQIPRKTRVGSGGRHDKGLERFFDAVLDSIVRNFNFDVIKVCVIASPGFLKEDFLAFMLEKARKDELKVILDSKDKFLLAHSSSGHKHALKEALADPHLAEKLKDTAASAEVKALDDFFQLMHTNPDRAFYGYKHVKIAQEANAIDTLLITDELFRIADIRKRKMWVDLVEAVREAGGTVHIFSNLHLTQISGVAAMLRFPLPEIDMGSDSESDSDDDKSDDEANSAAARAAGVIASPADAMLPPSEDSVPGEVSGDVKSDD